MGSGSVEEVVERFCAFYGPLGIGGGPQQSFDGLDASLELRNQSADEVESSK